MASFVILSEAKAFASRFYGNFAALAPMEHSSPAARSRDQVRARLPMLSALDYSQTRSGQAQLLAVCPTTLWEVFAPALHPARWALRRRGMPVREWSVCQRDRSRQSEHHGRKQQNSFHVFLLVCPRQALPSYQLGARLRQQSSTCYEKRNRL